MKISIIVAGLGLLLFSIYLFHKVRNELKSEEIHIKKYTFKYLCETIPDFILCDLKAALHILISAICLLLVAFFIF